MIAILDYGVGNLFSLRSSLQQLGLQAVVTADAAAIRAADRLILPGVGAFGDAMAKLTATGLVPVLKEQAEQKPLLGICRYGSFYLPMDEALVLCAVDLSGRCTLNWDVRCKTEKVGDFDVECASEFWLGFARNVPATVHFVQFAGENTHHILEACFKGAGHALAAAVKIDAAHRDEIPSTKGLLV